MARSFQLPGSWIEHPDRDWAFSVQLLLGSALGQLEEASLLLELFEPAWAEYSDSDSLGSDKQSRARLLAFLYARSFIYAFDGMVQLVRVIGKLPHLPDSAKTQCDLIEAEFGHCRKIRNSLQHFEDRIRGLGPKQTRIRTSILVTGGLAERRFGATIEDGSYSELEVSVAPVELAKRILTELVWSFEWLGPGNQRMSRFGA